MVLKSSSRLVTISSLKIADLQENDTVAHEEDISGFVPIETQAIIISVKRISGTGNFMVYPSSHATDTVQCISFAIFTVPIKDAIMKWKNTVANDDWDIFLHGYFLEKGF